MGFNDEQFVQSTKFSEVLDAKIKAKEGVFEIPHPFMRTACRGLARRLNPEIEPMGFVIATESYILDMKTGIDGFTNEPMPSDVTDMDPIFNDPIFNILFRKTAIGLAKEAYGDDFAISVNQIYDALPSQDS